MKQKKVDIAAVEKQKQEEQKRETEPEVPTLRLAQTGD
jgi:hypothetical protein